MQIKRTKVYYSASVSGRGTTYYTRTASRFLLLVDVLRFAINCGVVGVEINFYTETAEEIAASSIVTRLIEAYEFDRADAFQAAH